MSETLAYCESHNLDLWRINVLAHMAVAALEDGRWTEAADAATRVLEDPRDSPWPHAQALLVLALVRARRGDPDCSCPARRGLRLDIPPDEVEAHRRPRGCARRDRVARAAARRDRRGDAPDASSAALAREMTPRSVNRLDSGGASPGSRPMLSRRRRGHSRSAWPARGKRRPPNGRAAADRTRRRSRSRRRARRRRFDRPTTTFSGSAHSRPRGSCRSGCGRSVSGARAGTEGFDTREPRRAHGPRARCPRSARGRAPERPDRRAARRLPPYRRPPCVGDPAQARGRHARRGRGASRRARAPRGLKQVHAVEIGRAVAAT